MEIIMATIYGHIATGKAARSTTTGSIPPAPRMIAHHVMTSLSSAFFETEIPGGVASGGDDHADEGGWRHTCFSKRPLIPPLRLIEIH
jgi:hypothetical protein